MTKHVIVIASGETERRSLPHLVMHLQDQNVYVDEVRYPPGNKALNVDMAEKLVKAVWYENVAGPPDKFVVLLDVDGKAPDEVLRPLEEQLPGRLGAEIQASIQYAYAQWHLEAWYFADAENLKENLGRSEGSVGASNPDKIQNPKNHLRNLLGNRVYTAAISEEISKTLSAQTIAQRSPSFRGFLDAVMNGDLSPKETEVA